VLDPTVARHRYWKEWTMRRTSDLQLANEPVMTQPRQLGFGFDEILREQT